MAIVHLSNVLIVGSHKVPSLDLCCFRFMLMIFVTCQKNWNLFYLRMILMSSFAIKISIS